MDSEKLFSLEDVKNSQKTWMVIHNSVYDLSEFLNKHPGGKEVLLEFCGKNATKAFDNVGHSSDAMEEMKKYKIGELVESDRTPQGEAGPSGSKNCCCVVL